MSSIRESGTMGGARILASVPARLVINGARRRRE
jgi:hypothetical protein